MGYGDLALDGACGQTGDELTVCHQVNDQNGDQDHAQNGAEHSQRTVQRGVLFFHGKEHHEQAEADRSHKAEKHTNVLFIRFTFFLF